MNEITMWDYEGTNVRTVEVNGEPWFVGKDVAEVLGYSNTRDALAKHVDEEDKNTVAFHDGIAGNPNLTVINESGVYSLIFSSKLPEAKRFKHWVTSVVLPSIRKMGAYSSISPTLKYLIELEQKQQETQKQVENLREIFSANRDNWKGECDKTIQKIAVKRYNDMNMSFFILTELLDLLDERLGVNTTTRMKNIKKRMEERGCKYTEIRKVRRIDAVMQDKKLIDGFITVVREMAAEYGV